MKHHCLRAPLSVAFGILLLAHRSEAANLTWEAGINANWDTSTANWRNVGTPALFTNGYFVTFNDAASNFTVNIQLAVVPAGVTVSNSFDYIFSGPGKISGTNSLLKTSTARLTILNSNDYSGGTTVSNGTLQLGNGGGSGSILGNVLDQDALVFNRSNALTFSGAISGYGSVTKLGAGELTLAGISTYSGSTFVNAGALRVNGRLNGGGTVAVQSGATLKGTGTILGAVSINAGATLAPSNPAGATGSLTISNFLSLAGTTILRLNKSAGTNEKVTGLSYVNYGGSLVVSNLAGALAPGDSFLLFDASAYYGAFASIQPASPGPGLAWDLSRLPTNGTLRVVVPSASCLTMSCGGDKAVACGSAWTFDMPTNIVDCCSNHSLIVTTATNGLCPTVITRTWLATNICGYSASCSQTVTISNAPPTINCYNFAVACGDTWTNTPPPAYGCCSNTSVVLLSSITNGAACPSLQFITNIWQISDCCSNNSACVQTVTVNPQTLIVLTSGTPTLTLTWPSNLVLTWPSIQVQWSHYGTNIAGATNIFLTLTNFNPANAGPYGVTVSGSGLLVFNQFLVFASQLSLNCHPNKTVFCGTPWSFDPPDVFNGVCTNANVNLSYTTVTNLGCPQDITRTWLATDACGHSNTCSQTITVRTTPPIIYVPAEVVVYGCSNALPVTFTVTANNTCTVGAPNTCAACPKVLLNCFPPSGSLFGMGTNTVTCYAWDLCGATNFATFQVVVLPDPGCCQPPQITAQPQTVVTALAGTAVFQAPATGSPALTYQWRKDGANLSDGGDVSGALTPTLTISPTQNPDAGGYSLLASNSCGVSTSIVAQLFISSDYLPDGALSVTASNAVIVGNNATYKIRVSNEGALPLQSLTLSGTFSGVNAALISTSPGCSVTPSGNDFSLTCALPVLPLGTSVVYTVTFQASQPGTLTFAGSLDTAPGEIIVNNNSTAAATAFGYPPAILSNPVGFSGSPGGSGSLTVSATGTAPLDYYWRLDNVPVSTGDTLNFSELHSSDEGAYAAVASNAWGTAASSPAIVTLSFPGNVTAGIDGSQVLQVLGKASATDLEIRLKPGDPTTVVVEDLGASVIGEFSTNSFNKLVVNLGDGDNQLVFNDANGIVTDLNLQFEIHGGTGSNLVVASSQGIDLSALPGLVSTLQSAPDFKALTTNYHSQGYSGFVTPALAMANRLYTNLVLTSQMLKQMANTNLFVSASNRIAQARQLGDLATAYANEGAWRFSNAGFSAQQFTNCLFGLIAQLEGKEDSVAALEGDDEDDDTVAMDDLSEQMDELIENYEASADQYQDALEQSGNDFENRAGQNVQGPGDQLGNTDGPQLESLAGDFSALASQLLEAGGAQAELDGDAFAAQAVDYEALADSLLVTPAAQLNQAIEIFTALADPLGIEPLAAIATGTNAGCDKDIDANHKVLINIGGIIIGTHHNDKIIAKPKTFLILGLGGDDLIIGSDDSFNFIHGGSGDDEIHGQAKINLLFGGKGNDCMFGSDGDFDLLYGGDGNDHLDGGDGLNLIIGGKGDDKMVGGDDIDVMIGGEGDDDMDGGDGINIMFGGPGKDTMKGGNGKELDEEIPGLCKITIGSLMFGGDGDDTMTGGDGIDIMFGGNGNDTMDAGENIDLVFGNAGNDTINGGDGGPLFYVDVAGVKTGFRLGNLLFGGSGNDVITGGRDIDLMFGGDGNDTIKGSYSYPFWKGSLFTPTCGEVDIGMDDDLIFGGPGNDILDGGYGTDFIFGGPGNDTIYGNGEPFRLLDGAEIGFLFGGSGNDTIIGGPWDTITLAFGNDDNDDITGSKFGVMNLLFGNDGADTIHGNGDLFNLIFGGDKADDLYGGALLLDLMFGGPGNDNMHGGSFGALDVMFGGDGDDTMTGEGSLVEVQFGNDGNDHMDSGLCLIYAMWGNDGCDTMIGNALLGIMFGNDGDDTMTGGFGIDIMFGGPGPDLMNGGDGPDIMFGGAGDDVMYGGTDSWPNLMFGNAGNDTIYGGSGPDILLGNRGDDHIYGGGGPDIIFGGRDHDVIDGGDGPDLIFGGKEDDCIVGGAGSDLIFGGAGNDWINGGDDGDLIFGNSGDDTILSGNGTSESSRNYVFGNRGNDNIRSVGDGDRVWGNRDNDTIQSYGYDVRLRGNGGDDKFDVQDGSASIFGGRGTDIYKVDSGSIVKVKSASVGTFNSPNFLASGCAEVRGVTWLDSNQNGVRDNNEPLVGGIKVYLDLNNDGIWQSNEPYTISQADDSATCADETGSYSFAGLPEGAVRLREVPPAGYHQDFPITSWSLSLGPTDLITGKDFGHSPGGGNITFGTVSVSRQGSNFRVQFQGAGGPLNIGYRLLSTTNLTQPMDQWTAISTGIFDGGGGFSSTNLVPANVPQRFFRLTYP